MPHHLGLEMSIETLQSQYEACSNRAEQLRGKLEAELTRLLEHERIALGVPIGSRVKTWESIAEKLERKDWELSRLEDLDDLVGIRLILLFRSDLWSVKELISDTFEVISTKDSGERLGDKQFGYQSQHYVVRLPKSWLASPATVDPGDLRAEIQVRTLAQHTWAAASHKLQYKREKNVPPALRRAISRLSAVLETVDSELDRVVEDLRAYRNFGIPATKETEPLNVDLLAFVLGEVFPSANRKESERYSDLIQELARVGVNTVADLRALLKKRSPAAMESEHSELLRRSKERDYRTTTEERVNQGVFFSHVGLARQAIRQEYPKLRRRRIDYE
ncbi:MAG TPA: hypothetical protein VN851_28005 [Thermoanaerobaculia bacterium]|nr:hypothetical protein [Thermoanaerobaculia bacterium]